MFISFRCSFILFDCSEIVRHSEFLHVGHEYLVNLIKADDLVVRSEEQVYEAVLNWIRFNRSERQQYVAELMANIRFPLMSQDYLSSHVETEPLLKDNQQCRDLILNALKYHACDGQPSTDVQLPQIRRRLNSLKKILMFGRSTLDSVEWCNLGDGRWTRRGNMPTKRAG